MNIHLKRCKKCDELFDIGTNFDICPECRIKINEVKENEGISEF